MYIITIAAASPVSILYKSIAGCYRPVSYPDGPITARYRFIKNASWVYVPRVSGSVKNPHNNNTTSSMIPNYIHVCWDAEVWGNMLVSPSVIAELVWLASRENSSSRNDNHKGPDQSVHPRSLKHYIPWKLLKSYEGLLLNKNHDQTAHADLDLRICYMYIPEKHFWVYSDSA